MTNSNFTILCKTTKGCLVNYECSVCLTLETIFLFTYRLVDSNILSILRQRYEDCRIYESPDGMRKCKPLYDIYEKAEENYSIKC